MNRVTRWTNRSGNRLFTREDGNWTRFGETYFHTRDKVKGVYFRHSWVKNVEHLDRRLVWLEARERRRMEQ